MADFVVVDADHYELILLIAYQQSRFIEELKLALNAVVIEKNYKNAGPHIKRAKEIQVELNALAEECARRPLAGEEA